MINQLEVSASLKIKVIIMMKFLDILFGVMIGLAGLLVVTAGLAIILIVIKEFMK